jgi:xanthine dehydrogenase molybdenum-binding subunit
MSELKTVGKNASRVDVRAKATGRAQYAADVNLSGMLYGYIVRCTEYAHARVKKLDLSEAAKAPGVVKVLGPEDVTKNQYNASVIDLMVPHSLVGPMGDIDDQNIFTTHVKHYGDGIAGIIATSEAAAEYAASKVIVEYEPLPVYLNAESAKQPNAVQIEERKPGNLAFELPEPVFPDNALGWGDVSNKDIWDECDLIVEDNFYTNKQKQCQMEPNSYVAQLDDQGRLTCWTSTQMPKPVQAKLSHIFEMPMSNVKVHQTVIGGGFGARLGMILEPQVCALALAVPGRPVKLQSPREEDWLVSPSRHPGDYWMKMGFKKDGTPVVLDSVFANYKGGYYLDGSGVAFTAGAWLQGLYNWQNLRYKGESYFTNQPPCGAYRGYGNPQTTFVQEQLIDRACDKLGLDPMEWRRKWRKGVGDNNWLGEISQYPSQELDACLDQGAEAIGWKEKRAKYAKQTGTKRRGIGCAAVVHTSGASPMLLEHTVCHVKFNEDASVVITFSCSDLGQGSHTTLRQIAAETLNMKVDNIFIKTSDTDVTGFDIGAHASRTIYVGGGAVMEACKDAKRQIFERAAKKLDVAPDSLEMNDTQVFVKDEPAKNVSLLDICKHSVYTLDINMETGPHYDEGQILGYASYSPEHCSPPWSACFVDLEIDTETGEIKLQEVVNCHDIGRAINPAIVEGQMDGGAQNGLGMALTEELYFNEDGIVQNNGFTDYKMLGASDMPKMTNIIVENPDPFGPFGAKGCGESALVTPVGATANAIFNAIGIQITDAPITPEKILAALAKQKEAV